MLTEADQQDLARLEAHEREIAALIPEELSEACEAIDTCCEALDTWLDRLMEETPDPDPTSELRHTIERIQDRAEDAKRRLWSMLREREAEQKRRSELPPTAAP